MDVACVLTRVTASIDSRLVVSDTLQDIGDIVGTPTRDISAPAQVVHQDERTPLIHTPSAKNIPAQTPAVSQASSSQSAFERLTGSRELRSDQPRLVSAGKYTPEEDAILRQGHQLNLNCSEIKQRFGLNRSTSSIRSRRIYLEIPQTKTKQTPASGRKEIMVDLTPVATPSSPTAYVHIPRSPAVTQPSQSPLILGRQNITAPPTDNTNISAASRGATIGFVHIPRQTTVVQPQRSTLAQSSGNTRQTILPFKRDKGKAAIKPPMPSKEELSRYAATSSRPASNAPAAAEPKPIIISDDSDNGVTPTSSIESGLDGAKALALEVGDAVPAPTVREEPSQRVSLDREGSPAFQTQDPATTLSQRQQRQAQVSLHAGRTMESPNDRSPSQSVEPIEGLHSGVSQPPVAQQEQVPIRQGGRPLSRRQLIRQEDREILASVPTTQQLVEREIAARGAQGALDEIHKAMQAVREHGDVLDTSRSRIDSNGSRSTHVRGHVHGIGMSDDEDESNGRVTLFDGADDTLAAVFNGEVPPSVRVRRRGHVVVNTGDEQSADEEVGPQPGDFGYHTDDSMNFGFDDENYWNSSEEESEDEITNRHVSEVEDDEDDDVHGGEMDEQKDANSASWQRTPPPATQQVRNGHLSAPTNREYEGIIPSGDEAFSAEDNNASQDSLPRNVDHAAGTSSTHGADVRFNFLPSTQDMLPPWPSSGKVRASLDRSPTPKPLSQASPVTRRRGSSETTEQPSTATSETPVIHQKSSQTSVSSVLSVDEQAGANTLHALDVKKREPSASIRPSKSRVISGRTTLLASRRREGVEEARRGASRRRSNESCHHGNGRSASSEQRSTDSLGKLSKAQKSRLRKKKSRQQRINAAGVGNSLSQASSLLASPPAQYHGTMGDSAPPRPDTLPSLPSQQTPPSIMSSVVGKVERPSETMSALPAAEVEITSPARKPSSRVTPIGETQLTDCKRSNADEKASKSKSSSVSIRDLKKIPANIPKPPKYIPSPKVRRSADDERKSDEESESEGSESSESSSESSAKEYSKEERSSEEERAVARRKLSKPVARRAPLNALAKIAARAKARRLSSRASTR